MQPITTQPLLRGRDGQPVSRVDLHAQQEAITKRRQDRIALAYASRLQDARTRNPFADEDELKGIVAKGDAEAQALRVLGWQRSKRDFWSTTAKEDRERAKLAHLPDRYRSLPNGRTVPKVQAPWLHELERWEEIPESYEDRLQWRRSENYPWPCRTATEMPPPCPA